MFNYKYSVASDSRYSGFPFPPPFPVNYPPNFLPPPNFTNPPPSITSNNFLDTEVNLKVILEKRKKDTEFINNFISEEQNTSGQLVNPIKTVFKLSDFTDGLRIIFKNNQLIKSICAEMRHKNLSQVEWQEKMEIVEKLKNEITDLLLKFKDVTIINIMKQKLEKRKKKRLREKRKNDILSEENKKRGTQLNLEIDNWIKKKQDLIEKEKQEEILRKDADIVLADVRGKRNDAKKFSSLLKEMHNFRNVKVKIARARGENFPLAADQVFNNIIGNFF